jgi:hypothetical protein
VSLSLLLSLLVAIRSELKVRVEVKVTLRLTVSQSVSLGVDPCLGLMTRCLLLFDSYGLIFVGALSNEWTGLAFLYAAGPCQQSFSCHSPLGLATIFYCLRFETSLFVASYDSQDHGGEIRPRLHTGGGSYDLQLSLYSRSTDRIGNTIPLLMTHTAQKTRHVISRQSIGALTIA